MLRGAGRATSLIHDCHTEAIRSSPYLLDGKIWIDATHYHVVRVEGTAVAASALTGRPTVERDCTDIDGVPVAIHARSVPVSSS